MSTLTSRSRSAGRGAGDPVAAFADVYDSTAPIVYALALAVAPGSAQAEQVTRESYVELWRSWRTSDLCSSSAIESIVTILQRRTTAHGPARRNT